MTLAHHTSLNMKNSAAQTMTMGSAIRPTSVA